MNEVIIKYLKRLSYVNYFDHFNLIKTNDFLLVTISVLYLHYIIVHFILCYDSSLENILIFCEIIYSKKKL